MELVTTCYYPLWEVAKEISEITKVLGNPLSYNRCSSIVRNDLDTNRGNIVEYGLVYCDHETSDAYRDSFGDDAEVFCHAVNILVYAYGIDLEDEVVIPILFDW
jgi:hypothetical protein